MDNPVRILQVFGSLDRGGAESMVMNIYRNIERERIQFDFVVHSEKEGAFEREIRKLGGRIYRMPAYNGKNHLLYIHKWNRFFLEHVDYRIVHCHIRSTASFIIKAAKKHGIFSISHSHSLSEGSGYRAIIKRILEYPLRYQANYFMACSEEAGKWLFGKRIVRGDNYCVLKNAIEVEKYTYNESKRQQVRKELQLDGELVLGNVGSFREAKNHLFLIDILREACKIHPKTKLVLIGDGELRGEIGNKIAEYHLTENVLMLGQKENVWDYLQAMDAFVFPSLFEGLGMAVVEAQVSGLRCFISERVPEAACITSSVHRITLESGAAAWAGEICHCNYNSRASHEKEAKKAGYDVRQSAKWMQEFYEKLKTMRQGD